jgi:hypothetical protein
MSNSSSRNPATRPREAVTFPRKGFSSARAVGSFLPALTTKALQKYGFSAAGLILDWPSIVGAEIARYTAPERLSWPRRAESYDEDSATPPARRSGAVLVLRVEPAKALDVQYRASHIIERINTYFGYAAVGQLRLIQAPMPVAPAKREARSVARPLTREVAGITDPRLRDALARLGAEIMSGR